jgi:hypothetical protein
MYACNRAFFIFLVRFQVLILMLEGQVAIKCTLQKAHIVARMIIFVGKTVKGGTSL